ncbi:subtilisin-like protein [Vararia minispora EC-137]|uniref:Subtilisin-like protein n=1 Tax=Vararia minispora EC-137 TaxID=1314806 RepID=A0ACB8QHV2_9AGAM|nr:subtilisin-like protein [Vararia minispora EC-137]
MARVVSFSLLFLAVTLVASALAASVPTFVVHDRRDAAPESFVNVGAAPPDRMLDMRINLAMNNRDGLEAALMAAATPGSPTFRQWLSKAEVESFAAPSAETKQAVMDWLSANAVEAKPVTPAGDWLAIRVPVSKANALFNADFSVFEHVGSRTQSVRTLEYSLPAALTQHIRAVHPTTAFSGPLRGAPVVAVSPLALASDAAAPASCNTTITPSCLANIYNLPTTPISSSNSTLAVSAFSQQNANFADLKTFLQRFRPDISSSLTFSTTLIDGATNPQTANQAGVEANLDIQYTVGLANGIPTAFVDVGLNTQDGADAGFLDIINALIAESNPPLVISTSYGFDTEASLSQSLTFAMCDQYMQLTSRGVSITFASGDGGVASTPGVSCNNSPFPPTFPTCPFATLVGATVNVNPEKGAALSAGGFSNFFPQQTWQTAAVEAYLTKLGSTNAGLFNRSGRAYPDVSAQGERVQIVLGGRTGSVGGTSCSSPIFSSAVALVNDQLLRAGKAPLGFLNPWLYANPQAFNDITTGNNPGCNTQGFPALAGWDPVTGLGTPNYTAMLAAALAA